MKYINSHSTSLAGTNGLREWAFASLTTSPILKTEAVACNLPRGVVSSAKCSKKKVLVEEVFSVSIKLHGSAGHNKNCILRLGSFLFSNTRERCQFTCLNKLTM